MINTKWKTVFDSVCGTSHAISNLPCQDSCRVKVDQKPDGELLVVACADGAGSAKHSELGSTLACDRLLELICQSFVRCSDIRTVTREHALEWLEVIRAEVFALAESMQIPPRELATTLLGAAVSYDAAIFLQIGDGAIVVRRNNGFECVFWPQSGEYANTTNFITDINSQVSLVFNRIDEPIDECVLFTDGLERLALNFNERKVHQPFIEPMLAVLRKSDETANFFEPLRQFLESRKINDRTDDDKTLILATRLTYGDNVL